MYNSKKNNPYKKDARNPCKGHMSHPSSHVEQYSVKELLKYYKIREAEEAADAGKPPPAAPPGPYGRPLSQFVNYKSSANYVGHEHQVNRRPPVKPAKPHFITRADGRKVLVDHTGVRIRMPGDTPRKEDDDDDGIPRSRTTGVRYMSYDPTIDDPDNAEFQDEWVSEFGKLKASAARRLAKEKLIFKLGYDPDRAKLKSREFTGKLAKARRLRKFRESQALQMAELYEKTNGRAGEALPATMKHLEEKLAKTRKPKGAGNAFDGSRPGSRRRGRKKPKLVSVYNQHKLRPESVKPVSYAPMVDADSGEPLVPNKQPVLSPRDYLELERLKMKDAREASYVDNLEQMKKAQLKNMLELIGHEWRREGQRLAAYRNEPFKFRKKWLGKRLVKERAEARHHIQQLRRDNEMVLAQQMAAEGFLK